MIVSKTPLRLEFAGGSTDLANFYRRYPGRILNTSIDKYIIVTVHKIHGTNSRVICDGKTQNFYKANAIDNPIVKMALSHFKIKDRLEINIISDVDTSGSGLGSSSSLFVGLINALSLYRGNKLNKRELAELACHLEIDLMGAPIGKQDQYAATYGGLSLYTFNKQGRVSVKNLKLKKTFKEKLEKHLLVFHSGRSHSSTKILNDQNKYFNNNFDKLKQMGDLSVLAAKLLIKEDTKGFARCLEKEWKIKKSLLGYSKNAEIEKMYEDTKNAGAWGGRLSGAGGGGYLFVFAPTAKHKQVIKALKKYTLFPVKFIEDGSGVACF
jgi:D-glycero-alpha-D-manno-heptose-7-phosphate kinase